jgi:hypothetical protein
MRLSRSLLVLALCLLPCARVSAAETAPATLAIEYPAEGQAIGGPDGVALISARIRRGADIDVMLVIDVSESTTATAGDVDGDGTWTPDPSEIRLRKVPKMSPDSVFAAELLAAETLLSQLDPRATRVGLIHFSGDTDPSTFDATVAVPLTHEHERVREALAALREKGPAGRSNLLQGIQLATIELCATKSALSEARPGAQRTTYLFTDGNPTLPLDAATHQNRRLAIAAAAKAQACGVSIHAYGLGPKEDTSMAELGRVTRGSYRRIEASDLARRNIPAASLVRLKEVEIENLTTGARATALDAQLEARERLRARLAAPAPAGGGAPSGP